MPPSGLLSRLSRISWAQNSLDAAGNGEGVFAFGNDSRHAFGIHWNRTTGACTPLPGLDALDLGMEFTRVFGGSQRTLLLNSGLNLADDAHQAFWLARDGLTPLPLPRAVRPRQAYTLAQRGDDVVMFGGNHDVGLVLVDAPPDPADATRPRGTEGDGLHFDLAAGTVTAIPQGPLAPRARPLCALLGDRLYVLWGEAPSQRTSREACTDGASFRLR